MALTLDVCVVCNKSVIKDNPHSSSDMIRVIGENTMFEYMNDQIESDPKDFQSPLTARPSLRLKGEYCPDCLVAVVKTWAESLKKLPRSSTVDPGRVIFANGQTLTASGKRKKPITKPQTDSAGVVPGAHQSTIDEQLTNIHPAGCH